MRILFVAARFPSPARQGFRVRASHQIRLLAPRHRITLLAFAPTERSREAHADLARHCEDVVTVPLGRREMLASLARGVLSDRPLQTALYETPAMRRAVARLLAERRHDVVHVQLARMARHLEGATLPVVVDRAAIGDFPNLTINPNGVELARFPFSTTGRISGRIVFTGNLGYFPNVDAVEWFAKEVLPRVQRTRPDATFIAAGTRPHRRVRALADTQRSIVVQEDVPDVGAILASAAVAVAPMHAGSGQPLKILEAMACGTPVVATSLAASGLDAEPERHLLVGDDAETFAAQVVRALSSSEVARSLAGHGRRLMEERYTWERSVATLASIYSAIVP